MNSLSAYGRNLGLAFQLIDDVLDVTSSPEVLGKSIGKDSKAQKATLCALLGIESTRTEARARTSEAREALNCFPTEKRESLLAIADLLLQRAY